MGKLTNIIFFGFLFLFIDNLVKNTEFFDVPDTDWIESKCVPLHNYWKSNKCFLYDNSINIRTKPIKCWVYQESGFLDIHNNCDISFCLPRKKHIIASILSTWSLFGFIGNFLSYK